MTSPTFSIITPTYNAEKALDRTLRSVASQTYRKFEHIVVDGASTDNTIKCLESYRKQIPNLKISSAPDKGIYDAMNKGIRSSNGQFLIFLNADDKFANSEVLEELERVLPTNPNIDLIYGNTNVFDKIGDFIKTLKPLPFNKRNLARHGTRTVCHQSICIARDLAPNYSLDYRLKGELNWYYDIQKQRPRTFYLNIAIADFYLGGLGSQHFWTNLKEKWAVNQKQNGTLTLWLNGPQYLRDIAFYYRAKLKRQI